MLAAPPDEPAVPRKVIVWTVVTAVILVLGLIVTVVGLRHFEKLAAQPKRPGRGRAASERWRGAGGL